jgi:hypothetical protein
MTLKDSVKDPRTLHVVRNYQVRNIGLDLPIEYFWKHRSIEMAPGDALDKLMGEEPCQLALKRLRGFDFVGLAEHFDLSLCCLCHRFGWKPDFGGERTRQTQKEFVRGWEALSNRSAQ